jgi:hypothetical protein
VADRTDDHPRRWASHATGSNFYELRHWTDAQWQAARAAIKAQNDKDRAQRSV